MCNGSAGLIVITNILNMLKFVHKSYQQQQKWGKERVKVLKKE